MTDGANEGAAAERRGFWSFLGPGLITGASDDDPSGIATYSQMGAQWGYSMAWTMVFSYPLMAAMQEIAARVGRVTGRGIAGNIGRHYSRWLLRIIVTLLVAANVINLGADLGAMGEALALLIGGSQALYVVLFATGCAAAEIFSRYSRYVSVLKWTTVTLLAYAATVVAVHVDWPVLFADALVPHIELSRDYAVGVVAIFGTTISPYLFFWQSSQEAEDERMAPGEEPLLKAPEQAPAQIQRIRLDTYVGMAYSNAIGLCILVTAAATLHGSGIKEIATAADAAQALRPIAGPFAAAVFAAGIIGTGLLAVPVLAGSAAYAVAEANGWRTGLGRLPHEAKAFYGAVAGATLVGIGFNFVDIDPIRALFLSAVLNGVVAVPLMIVMMVMTNNPKIMGSFVLPPALRVMGWLATLVMAATVAALFLTSI